MKRRGNYRRRAILLRTAKAVQWLGAVWNFAWWGYALWKFPFASRFSDAVADAVPAAVLGGLGFAFALVIAWVIKVLAYTGAARTKTAKEPAEKSQARDDGRDP